MDIIYSYPSPINGCVRNWSGYAFYESKFSEQAQVLSCIAVMSKLHNASECYVEIMHDLMKQTHASRVKVKLLLSRSVEEWQRSGRGVVEALISRRRPITLKWPNPEVLDTRFHDNSSTDISSTTLRLQTFRLQTFRLLLYTRVKDSYASNFCFNKSLFSSIPTSTYTVNPFINPTSTDTMIIQHI